MSRGSGSGFSNIKHRINAQLRIAQQTPALAAQHLRTAYALLDGFMMGLPAEERESYRLSVSSVRAKINHRAERAGYEIRRPRAG